ncbi:hypothetical protein ACFQ5N_12190 [Lutibacter holmesii]|uniref:Uncharacterized protein n=1 Tax=Lutibacter holmesii TaxID=1137985 RepID=A0ABW3WTH3_9FLAO
MKNQFFGILFYLLYLLAMIRPIIPIIEYHANYDYIATVLCENRDKPFLACNGKCYLEKQLKKVTHDSHDHNSTIPQINFDDYPVSPLGQFTYNVKDFDVIGYKNIMLPLNQNSQEYLNSLFKPPRLLS